MEFGLIRCSNRPKLGFATLSTHHREGQFWPLRGEQGGRTRFARTSVFENLEMLLDTNRCDPYTKSGGKDEAGISRTKWADCPAGSGPIELLVTDQPFDFQDWWIDEIIDRISDEDTAAQANESAPSASGPVFRQSDDPEAEPDAVGRFKRPGADSGSRFKRVD